MKEETYIGHSVHNKQSNISFKNKKKVRKPQEEWYRVENTHEAIISEEVFQKVQELIASRRRKRRNGTTQIFAGLIKCADCGWSLAYGENKQNKNPYGYYHCSKNGHAAQAELLEAVRKTNKRIVSTQAENKNINPGKNQLTDTVNHGILFGMPRRI